MRGGGSYAARIRADGVLTMESSRSGGVYSLLRWYRLDGTTRSRIRTYSSPYSICTVGVRISSISNLQKERNKLKMRYLSIFKQGFKVVVNRVTNKL